MCVWGGIFNRVIVCPKGPHRKQRWSWKLSHVSLCPPLSSVVLWFVGLRGWSERGAAAHVSWLSNCSLNSVHHTSSVFGSPSNTLFPTTSPDHFRRGWNDQKWFVPYESQTGSLLVASILLPRAALQLLGVSREGGRKMSSLCQCTSSMPVSLQTCCIHGWNRSISFSSRILQGSLFASVVSWSWTQRISHS